MTKTSALASQIQCKVPMPFKALQKKRLQHEIDQTCLAIADAPVGHDVSFSFLVLGDTDAGEASSRKAAFSSNAFSWQFAEQVMAHLGENRFLLHVGDVAYPSGSYENYLKYFLSPYRGLLTQLPSSPFYSSDEITFNRPLLPVPGNHDYASTRASTKLLPRALRRLCDRLRSFGIDWGHYGGAGGEAYAQTFLDDLSKLSPAQLDQHLKAHYTASEYVASDYAASDCTPSGISGHQKTCLDYRPGLFTRLPNRYYRFRYGGVDFFALDSNTWKTTPTAADFDQAQLDWLEQSLIHSWADPEVVGRVVYLHHSPYTTESFYWQQLETLWVRRHLRNVFERVAVSRRETKECIGNPPIVDLVLSGHAHCLEHLKTTQTGLGDAQIDWVVCGGSGAGLRRQRSGNIDILENVTYQGQSCTEVVARSQLYAGKHGLGIKEQNFHSFIRVDVHPARAQKISVCTFLVTDADGYRQPRAIAPLKLGTTAVKSHKMARV
ncbi:MAG: metallophosphoesterase family protein [Phormidesmis sp.]